MATRPLKDNETRLAEYDKLSRGKKQEIDLERRAALAKAKKENKAPFGNDAVDAYYKLNPLIPAKMRDEQLRMSAESKARRERRVQDAQDKADYKDIKPGVLFGDDVVHKLKGMKAGGKVRGCGAASRGLTKGKMK